jgi:predicted transcriptional regulator
MNLIQVYLFHPAQPASRPYSGRVASHVEELTLEVAIKPTIYMIQEELTLEVPIKPTIYMIQEELTLEVPIKPTIYMIQANNGSHAVDERFFF